MKGWVVVLLLLVLVVLAGGGFFVFRMGPRNIVGMLRYDQRRAGSLKVGDAAPDVALIAMDGRSEVRLADSVGSKPLVLVFGSYT